MTPDHERDDPIRLIGLRCKHAARLITQSMERPLNRREKWSLGFHLLVCKWCRRYRKQLRLIEGMVREFASIETPHSGARLPIAARRRIEEGLRRAGG